jgi:hypothetical protein
MAKGASTEVVGLIAIIIGGLLVMGGLMFLLTASFMKNIFPWYFWIPPVVQIVLGLLGSTAGYFLKRGNSWAKIVLLFVAIGLVVNTAFVASMFIATAERVH